ncbi:DUF4314 domain-containing protein [Staphylococcus hyicus]|uniref:DUF4314 domain-containing protein n=1 Tax=Staphylococcus hyicus TaxID=1284 RepID=UPI003132FFCF
MKHESIKVGDRVKLIYTEDPYTRLKSGALGTVLKIDGIKRIHVQWDDGIRLALIPDLDEFEVI